MNERTRVGRFALCVAGMATLGMLNKAHADTNSILAQTGITAAPGSGGGIISFYNDRPAINSSGQVVILSSLTGATDGAQAALLRADATGGLTLIARDLQPAPGTGGGTLGGFSTPTINSSGQVMAWASLNGTSDASTFGFFRGDGSTPLTALIRQNMSAAGNGTLDGPLGWDFSDTGAVSVVMNIVGSSSGNYGIFQGAGASITQVARDTQAAPGAGGGTFINVGTPSTNNLGQVAFHSSLTGTNNGTNQGIFKFNGSPSEVLRSNQPAPGGGNFNGFTGIPLLNDAGQVAFFASLSGAPDGAIAGFFRANPGSGIVAIARQNGAAPGGGTFGSNIGLNDSLQNANGQVLFQSPIDNAPDGSNSGIFRGNGSSLDAIARIGQAMPGGGKLTGFGSDMAITSGGAALFLGFLGNLPAGNTDNQALYLSDGRDTVQVARKGQPLATSTVTGFAINLYTYANGFNAVNDAGQVAYQANLADGSSVMVRFTPTLHFRSQFSGNWDTSDNWTLGIAPSAVHEVMIDPQFGVGVSGPAGNVTIGSLLLAAKQGQASLDLNAGGQLLVTGITTIKSTGQLTVSSGRMLGGSIINDGSLSVTVGGQLSNSTITNNGNLNIAGPTSISGPISNSGFMSVSHTTLTGGPITNLTNLYLDAATVSNSITNEVGSSMVARGTVNAPITNRGTINVNGLFTIQSITNSGAITVDVGESIALGSITNTGGITLNGGGVTSAITNNGGGIVQGGGGITSTLINNQGGLILANSPNYALSISSVSTNQTGARIRVADGSSLNINSSFSNSGLVTLGGESANLSVGGNQSINNGPSGIINGAGTIAATVSNSGTLRAEGGQLLITGSSPSNQSNALIQVSDGATLLFAQGMSSNTGTINVSGGSFINNSIGSFTNNGKISGYGTFTTGSWFNSGTMTFTGGFTTINGNVTNNGTRKIEVANNPALFTGNVTNFGIFKSTKTSITFGGTYTENGTFISDPADNFFNDVKIGEQGAWVGGEGDRFLLSGDLLSSSKNKSTWQTAQAELRFLGATNHTLSVLGEDRGISFDGYSDNFAWGTLTLDAGNGLTLADGDTAAGGALYVHRLLLGGGVGQISGIQSNGLKVYYDLGEPSNAYLGGQTYSLPGGGSISPVPEPGTVLLTAMMCGLLSARRRRRIS